MKKMLAIIGSITGISTLAAVVITVVDFLVNLGATFTEFIEVIKHTVLELIKFNHLTSILFIVGFGVLVVLLIIQIIIVIAKKRPIGLVFSLIALLSGVLGLTSVLLCYYYDLGIVKSIYGYLGFAFGTIGALSAGVLLIVSMLMDRKQAAIAIEGQAGEIEQEETIEVPSTEPEPVVEEVVATHSEEVKEEPVVEEPTPVVSVVEEKVEEPVVQEVKEEPEEEVKVEEPGKEVKKTSKQPVKKPAAPKKAPAKKPATKKPATAKAVTNSAAQDVEETKSNFQAKKAYHVTKRAQDNKWSVKFAKGQRAIKLFNTKEEAVAFANDLAKSQDAIVFTHASKGKNKGKIQ